MCKTTWITNKIALGIQCLQLIISPHVPNSSALLIRFGVATFTLNTRTHRHTLFVVGIIFYLAPPPLFRPSCLESIYLFLVNHPVFRNLPSNNSPPPHPLGNNFHQNPTTHTTTTTRLALLCLFVLFVFLFFFFWFLLIIYWWLCVAFICIYKYIFVYFTLNICILVNQNGIMLRVLFIRTDISLKESNIYWFVVDQIRGGLQHAEAHTELDNSKLNN